MTTFASYYSSIEQSVKPKGYFTGTQDLMKTRMMNSPVAIKGKSYRKVSKPVKSQSPYVKELMILAPWILAGASLVFTIAF